MRRIVSTVIRWDHSLPIDLRGRAGYCLGGAHKDVVELMIVEPNITGLCDEIDMMLATEQIRVEDIDRRVLILRPLEKAMEFLDSVPPVPDTAGGKIAISVWYRIHPEQADLDRLLVLIDDRSPLVRLNATDALMATLKSLHKRWSESRFPQTAKQLIAEQREVETSPIIAHQLDQISENIGLVARPRKKPRTKVVKNPYVAGLPVYGADRFFGRDAILTQIKNYLERTSGVKSILLYGARRTGKTSVLYQIRNGALGNKLLPVYLDLQSLAGTELPAFLRAVLLGTLDAMRARNIHTGDLPPIEAPQLNFSAMREFLHGMLAKLDDTSLLLMLDEYEVLSSYLANSDLARQMQSLLELEPNLFAIFAGSQKLEALKEKQKRFLFLLDNARYIKISFLKRSEALELIGMPSKGKLEFASGVPDHILDYTAGHPFYTQLMCQTIFDNAKEAGGIVTTEDVDIAVRQFLQDPSPHVILTWNAMEIEQKVVGSCLAESQADKDAFVDPLQILHRLRSEELPIKISLGEVQQALNALRDIDWVERKEGGISYRFSMEIVRRWIVENRSIWELAERQREDLLSKVAGFWPQRFAWIVDFVAFPIILVVLISLLSKTAIDSGWLVLIALAAPLVYFVVSILMARSTLGMRLFHLRALSAKAMPLKPRQAIVYGLSLVARFFFVSAGFALVSRIFFDAFSGIASTLLIALSVILGLGGEALDVVSILYGRKRQGLYEKLARTLIVPASVVKD